jgi:hypothetical protein
MALMQRGIMDGAFTSVRSGTKLESHNRVALAVCSDLIDNQFDWHPEGLLWVFFQILRIDLD